MRVRSRGANSVPSMWADFCDSTHEVGPEPELALVHEGDESRQQSSLRMCLLQVIEGRDVPHEDVPRIVADGRVNHRTRVFDCHVIRLVLRLGLAYVDS